jgi:D-tyrosyl-tRNA(Tyr) deacylase
MKVIIQRVNHASVKVYEKIVGEISRGLLLLVGLGEGDDEKVLSPTANKIFNMRIFSDDAGRFDKSVKDIEGEILLVPQFTLFADTSKGRRPEFFKALKPSEAEPLFQKFVNQLQTLGLRKVEQGIFGADMKVSSENDGPVTIIVE